jgi:hypothetical protein
MSDKTFSKEISKIIFSVKMAKNTEGVHRSDKGCLYLQLSAFIKKR